MPFVAVIVGAPAVPHRTEPGQVIVRRVPSAVKRTVMTPTVPEAGGLLRVTVQFEFRATEKKGPAV